MFIVVVGLWAFVRPTAPTEKKDFLQAFGVLLAGLVGLGGLYFTWRNLDQTRQTTQRTLELTERGQITERFTRAIDQLGDTDDKGNKRIEIRLGGIYALERIARDSEQDHWPIMEVLTAYVRQNARWPPEEGQQGAGDAAVEMESKTAEVSSLASDIHAILAVLRRRTRSFGHGEPELLDLHETNLSGANLSGANLQKADLRQTNLQEADLRRANLRGVDLRGAYLRQANLQGVDLWRTNLQKADLGRANLRGVDLKGMYLHEANLWSANLRGADLKGAVLREADLSPSDEDLELTAAISGWLPEELPEEEAEALSMEERVFMERVFASGRGANLQGANLQGADLWRADLQEADLRRANLQGARLSGANLQGVDLSQANLSGARLWGANLWEANLTREQLEAAIGDENTTLSLHLKPPAHWGVKTDEQIEGD